MPESQPSSVKEDYHLKEKSELPKSLANPPKQDNSSNQEDRTSSQDEVNMVLSELPY